MAANVISALLTTMLVEVNDPVSRNFIEWGILWRHQAMPTYAVI